MIWSLGGVAAAILFGLMILTCADVIGRYVFDTPLDGAYELTELGLALIIFSALPIVTRGGEHVTVDIIDVLAGPRLLSFLTVVTDLICMGVLLMMAWVLWQRADMIAANGIHTQSLFIPLSPIAYFMAFTSLLSALTLLTGLYGRVVSRRRRITGDATS